MMISFRPQRCCIRLFPAIYLSACSLHTFFGLYRLNENSGSPYSTGCPFSINILTINRRLRSRFHSWVSLPQQCKDLIFLTFAPTSTNGSASGVGACRCATIGEVMVTASGLFFSFGYDFSCKAEDLYPGISMERAFFPLILTFVPSFSICSSVISVSLRSR